MSITSNDLRVGNWARIVGETSPYQWTVEDFALLNDEFPIHPEPIPLTPEILIDCGFEKNGTKELNDNWFIGNDEDGFYLQFEAEINYEYICVRYPTKHIKHLHQLQNFVYSLTGAEINFKNK